MKKTRGEPSMAGHGRGLRLLVASGVLGAAALLECGACRGETPAATFHPPPPRRTAGRCWVRYDALPAADVNAVRTAFAARNAPAWTLVPGTSLAGDPFSGFVTSGMHLRDQVGEAADVPSAEIQRRARDFIRANADLLGLSAADLAALRWTASPPPEFLRDTLVGWTASATNVPPGVSAPTTPVGELAPWRRQIEVGVAFQRDGVIYSFGVSILPEEVMCRRPLLSADSARRVPGIVGHEMELAHWNTPGSRKVQIAPANIEKVQLEVLEINAPAVQHPFLRGEPGPADLREYRLAYRVHVKIADWAWESWDFLVDAIDGHVLSILTLQDAID